MSGLVLINLTPSEVNLQTKWELEVVNTGHKGGYGGYPHVPADKGSKDIKMVFQIQDGQGWTFAKNADALWVTKAKADPIVPSSVPSEIDPSTIKTKQKDLQLSFVDQNNSPGELHYTLNFVRGSEKSSTLDPIIDNGGPGKFYENVWADFAVFAGILVLLFSLRPLFKKKNAPTVS